MKPRTALEIEADLAKTLYIRLPHTIKNANEIKSLFVGNVKVKMPRQSSRYCHVIFDDVEEKMKNLKNIKKLVIDGKHIIACPPRINPPEKRKKKEKKIKVPKPKPEPKVTKSLYVSNIKLGTKSQEIRDAFPGCTSMIMLKSKYGKNRTAIVKLGSIQLAGEYLRKEREWPEVRGHRLEIKLDTRKKSKAGKKKSESLKIYDSDNTDDGKEVTKKSSKQKKNETEDEISEEEEEDDEGELESSNADEDSEVKEE